MKKMTILGAGESGTGAALLAHAKGYTVFVSDKNAIAASYREQLVAHGIEFEEGVHTWERIQEGHEIIKSPGIPNSAPIIHAIQQAGIPIIDEIEFASRYTNAVLIGVTGSNGKSTTTHLIYHLLGEAGFNVGIAGNMGASFAKKVWQESHDYYVLELSNFQLEYLHTCKLHIACLLNITQNHLDRYAYKIDGYIAAKWRIIRNMGPQDHLIYNQEDAHIMNYLQNHQILPQKHPVSLSSSSDQGAYLQQDNLCIAGSLQLLQIPTQSVPLQGNHNLFNAMVAISAARLLGCAFEKIIAGLNTFKGLAHRMEWVAQINDVAFYNDSKSTTTESAAVALASFPQQPIVWIAGGYDKGNDYTLLQPLFNKYVKALICLGKDNQPLLTAFSNERTPIYETQSMVQAVQMAHRLAQANEVVLLSPACASYDLFKHFEDRGQQFKDAVLQLITPSTC